MAFFAGIIKDGLNDDNMLILEDCLRGYANNSNRIEQFEKPGLSLVYAARANESRDTQVIITESFLSLFEGYAFSIAGRDANPTSVCEGIKQHREDVAEKIDGQFRGIFFKSSSKEVVLSVDNMASRSIFYFLDRHTKSFIFASDLTLLTAVMRAKKIGVSIDMDGFFSVLVFGYVFDQDTLVKDVRRVKHGSSLIFDAKTAEIREKTFFSFNKRVDQSITEDYAIEQIDKIMNETVSSIVKKNNYQSENYLSLLSGGLDSRTSLLLAERNDAKGIKAITFGSIGCADLNIAQTIATDRDYEHLIYYFNNGNFIPRAFLTALKYNGGLSNLSATAHTFRAVGSFNLSGNAMLHTGQIGDVVFGSFVNKASEVERHIFGLGYSGHAQKSFVGDWNKIKEISRRYRDPSIGEIYSFEQRQINGTMQCDRALQAIIDSISPFYSRKLIEFSLSIPDRIRANEHLYLRWIGKMYRSSIGKYPWSQSFVRPVDVKTTEIGKLIVRVQDGLTRKAGFPGNSSTPYDWWYRNFPGFSQRIDEGVRILLDLADENIRSVAQSYIASHSGVISRLSAMTAVGGTILHTRPEALEGLREIGY